MKHSWNDRLESGRPLLKDGGTGTELRRRGFPMRADVWSALAAVTHFDLLRAIHLEHIEAGAEVITANTFATARFVLEEAGLGADFEAINRRSLQAAKEARDLAGRDVVVAASLSCLPPRFDPGSYPDRATERSAYIELAELFAAEGADLIVLEMLQDTEHAPLACAAARDSGLPFWLGLSCRQRDGELIAFDSPDVRLADCLDALLPFAPASVNIMHSPRATVLPALALVRERWDGSLGAYPALPGNGAIEDDVGTPTTPAELAALASQWIAQGARVIGGCCGTTPAHVRALAENRDMFDFSRLAVERRSRT
ncbi:MAG TPA: homocysteine S-methyltransferase family protein [Gammaproteobacteria bacterium]|nr:homocysteine S-methyltransferase family protein [Gammaproteobacteria bacterium]